jgi:hypothetical protein
LHFEDYRKADKNTFYFLLSLVKNKGNHEKRELDGSNSLFQINLPVGLAILE